MPPAERALRIAQIAGTSANSPWFTNICGELADRGFEVIAVIDSSAGDLGARLDARGIRHYKVPLYFVHFVPMKKFVLFQIKLPQTTEADKQLEEAGLELGDRIGRDA